MTYPSLPSRRSQDLVFTLYGDYLLTRDRPVWTGSLITLLGQLGLSPMAVRTVLSRMARKGWLTVERQGNRSYHDLTRKGRILLQEGRERIYHPPRTERWDGTWHLITYTIPEERRRLRDQLRVKLGWLGCGLLANGVWITPHDVRDEVAEIAQRLRITRHIEIFRANHTGFSSLEKLVEQCWDLDGINRRYAGFIARWQPDFSHCRSCGMSGVKGPVHKPCAAPADCFRRRFLLVHEYRAFPLEDPFLPGPLLPPDWQGNAAAELFESYHGVLAEPAERYVDDVCREGDAARAA